MTSEDLLKALDNGQREFRDKTFITKIDLIFLDNYSRSSINFIRCTFEEGVELYGINRDDLYIDFHMCDFNKTVIATSCKIGRLGFNKILHLTDLQVLNLQLDNLTISHDKEPLDINIMLDNIYIKNNLDCANLIIRKGDFVININEPKENVETNDNLNVNFKNSHLDNINFYGYLGKKSVFDNLIINRGLFINCTFNVTSFKSAQFGQNTAFVNCSFEQEASFFSCRSLKNTALDFNNCIFKNEVNYNGSSLYNLSITKTIFDNKVSFDGMEINTISFYQVIFKQVAYFDEVRINKILDKTYLQNLKVEQAKDLRRTLRVIKQELQKADNRIDYARFRVYEYTAYKHELKKELQILKPSISLMRRLLAQDIQYSKIKRDLFILKLSELVSDYGTDWKKALKCTIVLGLTLYSVLYFFEFYIALNLDNNTDFASGAFRFFMVTDFYSPFREREYLNNGISWTMFIIGKIVIAFGIYEMIQAFRKFKA